jgi:UDP-3-O-[3-hydroxymyristoyl] glucosamine N-acyltransferase
MPMTLKELADCCHARLEGGNAFDVVDSAADIKAAHKGQVTQLTHPRYTEFLKNSSATACFIAESFAHEQKPDSMAWLISADPEMSFIRAVELLHPARIYRHEIAEQAVIERHVRFGADIVIGPYAIISENVSIGDHSQILAGAYLGRNVKIGSHCRIYPYAVIYDDVEIGDHVIIHSGAVIGADGFGYKFRNHRHVKVPQVGNVVIEDSVEVGANTCIDRGALGSTVIGAGSKIDNLVQVGHNNKVGKHVIMCGLTGVSGSCTIEDYAILAGSSGVADHVKIGQGAVVMARSGVAGDIAAGTQVFGSPAKEKRLAYKEQVAISKLPELLKTVKLLEEKVQKLEKES